MRIGLFACALAALLAAAQGEAAAEEYGSADAYFESDGSGMEIRSDPSGADVYLNGVLRGMTPLELAGILPGRQRIVLEKDGYWTRSIVVEVPEGKRTAVRLKLTAATGILRVEPPSGDFRGELRVLIDGEPGRIGDNEVPEGLRSVRLRAFGFEDRSLSVFVRRGERETVGFVLRPAPFAVDSLRASRRHFNPANPGQLGSTVLSFRTSAPGTAELAIRNAAGEPVARFALPEFESWEQAFSWNGKAADGSPLPDGAYAVTLTARPAAGSGAEPVERTIETEVAIDSGIDIRPAAVSGGIGGLLFAPEARAMPTGSFQIDGTALFGAPPGGPAFGAPPFALGFRFAPVSRLEIAGTLRAVVSDGADAAIAFGASAKRILRTTAGGRRLALAAALRWTHAAETGLSSFGDTPGLEASLPFELPVAETGVGLISAHAVPSLLWEGAEGAPERASPTAAASGGASLRGRSFTLGVSARGAEEGISAAAEIRFFPQPSVLAFSAVAGGWISGGDGGVFAGVGLGILY